MCTCAFAVQLLFFDPIYFLTFVFELTWLFLLANARSRGFLSSSNFQHFSLSCPLIPGKGSPPKFQPLSPCYSLLEWHFVLPIWSLLGYNRNFQHTFFRLGKRRNHRTLHALDLGDLAAPKRWKSNEEKSVAWLGIETRAARYALLGEHILFSWRSVTSSSPF